MNNIFVQHVLSYAQHPKLSSRSCAVLLEHLPGSFEDGRPSRFFISDGSVREVRLVDHPRPCSLINPVDAFTKLAKMLMKLFPLALKVTLTTKLPGIQLYNFNYSSATSGQDLKISVKRRVEDYLFVAHLSPENPLQAPPHLLSYSYSIVFTRSWVPIDTSASISTGGSSDPETVLIEFQRFLQDKCSRGRIVGWVRDDNTNSTSTVRFHIVQGMEGAEDIPAALSKDVEQKRR